MTAPLLAALRHRSLQRPFISFELEKRMWRFAYKRGVPRLGEQSETYSRGAGRHVFAALHSLDRIAPSRGFDREERFLPQPPSTCLGQHQSPWPPPWLPCPPFDASLSLPARLPPFTGSCGHVPGREISVGRPGTIDRGSRGCRCRHRDAQAQNRLDKSGIQS